MLVGVVVLGPVAPGVVAEVVVVPDGHHRVAQVQRLGVRIGADLGQSTPVVVEGDGGVGRVVRAEPVDPASS